MKSPEISSRLIKPVAVASAAVALFGAGKAEASHPNFVTPEATLKQIYQPTAVKIGREALILAAAGNPNSSIKRDPRYKNTVIVHEETIDGAFRYELEADMHKKNGRPYAPSTFQALVKVTLGSNKTPYESVYMADMAQSGLVGGWDAIYTGTKSAQQGGGPLIAYADGLHPQVNVIVSNSARTLADQAVKAGPHEPTGSIIA